MRRVVKILVACLAACGTAPAVGAQPSTGTVTYQGVLTQGGQPVADGTYALTFRIYDAASGGVVVETVTVPGVQTVQGRFAALVPVSPSTFNGADRWWSVTFNGTELPRQKVTAAPYSVSTRGIVVDGGGRVAIGAAATDDNAMLRVLSPVGNWFAFKIGPTNTDVAPMGLRVDGWQHPTGAMQWSLLSPYAHPSGHTNGPAASVLQWTGSALLVGSPTDGRPQFRVGIGTASPERDLEVAGTTRTRVLEITGADLAENFDVAPAPGVQDGQAGFSAPAPGMVVSIDPARPGRLAVSSLAYDRRVAGVISGANGLDVGVVLGKNNEDPLIDGEHPVAMTGRVWVYADESAPGSKIEPGDRLTTSGTRPGYAMKVLDETRAPGAVIGKAMTSVDPKTGMVLVLVNLQ